jgi:hypothetical protein
VQCLNEAVALRNGTGNIESALFLAMAQHRLGNSAEARRWLKKATTGMTLRQKSSAASLLWYRQLEWRMLAEEANGLLKGGKRVAPRQQSAAN